MKGYSIPRPDGKIMAAVITLCLCLGTAWASYDCLYKATPDYSFRHLAAAVQAGDEAAVRRLTDIPGLSDQVFAALIREKAAHEKAPVLFQLSLLPQKDAFSQTMEQQILAANTDTTEQTETYLKQLDCPVPASGWQCRSISWSRQTAPGQAEITVSLYHETLQAAIPVSLTLERVSAHEWHVTGLSDAEGLLHRLKEAYAQALRRHDAAEDQRMAAVIQIDQVSSSLLRDNKNTYLRLRYQVREAEPNLSEIRGRYELRSREDDSLLYSAPLRLASTGDVQRQSQFLLNPLDTAQYALMQRQNLDDTYSAIHIISVRQQDGSLLERTTL